MIVVQFTCCVIQACDFGCAYDWEILLCRKRWNDHAEDMKGVLD